MTLQTRFLFIFRKIIQSFNKKIFVFKITLPIALFILLFGFILGNLFPSLLVRIRSFVGWDGLIIVLLVLMLELINCLVYDRSIVKYKDALFFTDQSNKTSSQLNNCLENPLNSTFFPQTKQVQSITYKTLFFPQKENHSHIKESNVKKKEVVASHEKETKKKTYKLLNYFKLGLMFGFFIDAFKVGS